MSKKWLLVGSNKLLLWFRFTPLCDWLKQWRHFLNQSEVNPKLIVTCWHAFSRAWRWFHVFASSCDWFIVLSAFDVIGRLCAGSSFYFVGA